ncbi:MAG TPA: Ku protein [Terriglobia bacterium]|nr:Ku protein [Terriglobia bacterium]
MASTIWKGHLSFGLVSPPLRLYAAARSERVKLHQLHRTCRTRLRRSLFCPTCNRIVEQSEVAKGYEYEKGQYFIVDDREIKKLVPEAGGAMEIREFVPLAEIDPLYYDASYFAVPEKPGQKAYQLLVKAIEESGQAALAKVVMHQREYLVAIRAGNRGLTLHTLFFASEVRAAPEYGHSGADVRPEELKLAKELVSKMSTHFSPEKYRDEYQVKLKQLLSAKSKGRKTPEVRKQKLAPVIDMMDALKKSLPRTASSRKRLRRSTHGSARRVQKRAS